jgi:hypothetical protein
MGEGRLDREDAIGGDGAKLRQSLGVTVTPVLQALKLPSSCWRRCGASFVENVRNCLRAAAQLMATQAASRPAKITLELLPVTRRPTAGDAGWTTDSSMVVRKDVRLFLSAICLLAFVAVHDATAG